MSSKLKLNSNAGGSVSLTAPDGLTTDEVVDVGNMGIESGESQDGRWVAYPDGTLISSRTYPIEITATNTSGSLFRSNLLTFSFVTGPYSFVDNPDVSYYVNRSTGIAWASGYVDNNTKCNIYVVGTSDTSSGYPGYIAVGRWK